MVEFAIFGFLVGAVFGLRFRVMVLLPLTLMAALATPVVALIVQLSLIESLKGFALCALALQSGYVFGSIARFSIAAARAARTVARPLNTVR
jgi:hypothetical protein